MTGAIGVTVRGNAETSAGALFRALELTLGEGQWTCLLGVSGVGKSTLLRLIAGLETHADFRGRIEASDGQRIPGRVAYMAQSDLLFPWSSVLGNVTAGARLRGERPCLARARTLLARVGLAEFEDRKPAALSGGQRQRVALARTLAEDRPVILLDEPFSALDAHTRSEMQDLAFELLEGRTVLLVTHDPGEAARLGHRIHVMTARGLRSIPMPTGEPPRPVDDPSMLACQGALHRLLRDSAPSSDGNRGAPAT
ncbi:MAG: ABC transporter ATP-binding protein [Thiotrichales bacterium]|nr:ABC transporter ATP-binding protein [Thiotrichales bacterium]